MRTLKDIHEIGIGKHKIGGEYEEAKEQAEIMSKCFQNIFTVESDDI